MEIAVGPPAVHHLIISSIGGSTSLWPLLVSAVTVAQEAPSRANREQLFLLVT